MRTWIRSLCAVFALGYAGSAIADETGVAVGLGVLGALIGAAQKDESRKQWSALTEPTRFCVGEALAARGTSIDQLVQKGIGPGDERIRDINSECSAIADKSLRKNFSCVVERSDGTQSSTRCDEVYLVSSGGGFRIVDQSAYIRGRINGRETSVGQIENEEAKVEAVRRDEEERQQHLAEQAKLEEQRIGEQKKVQEKYERISRSLIYLPSGAQAMIADALSRCSQDVNADASRIMAPDVDQDSKPDAIFSEALLQCATPSEKHAENWFVFLTSSPLQPVTVVMAKDARILNEAPPVIEFVSPDDSKKQYQYRGSALVSVDLAAEKAEQQRRAAEEEARQKADQARQATIAARDRHIDDERKKCVPAHKPGIFLSLWGGSNEQTLTELRNTTVSPLQAYSDSTAFLIGEKADQAVLSALSDRIDYDAAQWGAFIAKSKFNDAYTLESFHKALEVFRLDCLWEQHDRLGVNTASQISANAVSAALGRMAALDAQTVEAVRVLSKIPSIRYEQLQHGD